MAESHHHFQHSAASVCVCMSLGTLSNNDTTFSLLLCSEAHKYFGYIFLLSPLILACQQIHLRITCVFLVHSNIAVYQFRYISTQLNNVCNSNRQSNACDFIIVMAVKIMLLMTPLLSTRKNSAVV